MGDPALAQQEALERASFLAPGGAEAFLARLKNGSDAFAARFGATLGAYTYAVANAPDPSAPKPGFLDAIGAGMTIIVDPSKLTPDQLRAILPPAPAEDRHHEHLAPARPTPNSAARFLCGGQHGQRHPLDSLHQQRAVPFDTRRSGASGTGHMGVAFNGPVDWATDSKKLRDLLGYVTTL